MLYILGMSHAISVLRALDPAILASHQTYGGPTSVESPSWIDLPLPSALQATPFAGLKVFLIDRMVARIESGVLAASPRYWDLLDAIHSAPTPTALVSFIGGNEHSVLSMVEHACPYDFYTGDYTLAPMIPGRQPIALRVIERMLQDNMANTVAMLTAIRLKHSTVRVLHVMPPPPISSEAQIRRQPEIFREVFETTGITPLSVRVKIYRVYCRLLGAALQPLGIECLQAPVEATDALGGLADGYTLGATHGNEAYGSLVVQQLAHGLKE